MNLVKFHNEYERINRSDLDKKHKNLEYSKLMTQMEKAFNIPLLHKQEWEQQNKKIIALYRKIANSRDL